MSHRGNSSTIQNWLSFTPLGPWADQCQQVISQCIFDLQPDLNRRPLKDRKVKSYLFSGRPEPPWNCPALWAIWDKNAPSQGFLFMTNTKASRIWKKTVWPGMKEWHYPRTMRVSPWTWRWLTSGFSSSRTAPRSTRSPGQRSANSASRGRSSW